MHVDFATEGVSEPIKRSQTIDVTKNLSKAKKQCPTSPSSCPARATLRSSDSAFCHRNNVVARVAVPIVGKRDLRGGRLARQHGQHPAAHRSPEGGTRLYAGEKILADVVHEADARGERVMGRSFPGTC